jgi:hypothetical protein
MNCCAPRNLVLKHVFTIIMEQNELESITVFKLRSSNPRTISKFRDFVLNLGNVTANNKIGENYVVKYLNVPK